MHSEYSSSIKGLLIWRISSSGIWCRVGLLLSCVLDERVASVASETSLYDEPTRCHMSVDDILHSRRRENLKPSLIIHPQLRWSAFSSWTELAMIWKETLVMSWRYHPDICLRGEKKYLKRAVRIDPVSVGIGTQNSLNHFAACIFDRAAIVCSRKTFVLAICQHNKIYEEFTFSCLGTPAVWRRMFPSSGLQRRLVLMSVATLKVSEQYSCV
jgi:hypothetical protein